MKGTAYSILLIVTLLAISAISATAFTPPSSPATSFQVRSTRNGQVGAVVRPLRMADGSEPDSSSPAAAVVDETQEEEEGPMDEATRMQLEKQRKADELRAQEVFMKKSTGRHRCTNCDFEYDETKGDSYLIGGMVQPGTAFTDLPSNWRCPTCRASKDSFREVVEEIPGFEVNQGYGFGTNSLTAGQKSGLIFGGLGIFFVLFLSGYAMN